MLLSKTNLERNQLSLREDDMESKFDSSRTQTPRSVEDSTAQLMQQDRSPLQKMIEGLFSVKFSMTLANVDTQTCSSIKERENIQIVENKLANILMVSSTKLSIKDSQISGEQSNSTPLILTVKITDISMREFSEIKYCLDFARQDNNRSLLSIFSAAGITDVQSRDICVSQISTSGFLPIIFAIEYYNCRGVLPMITPVPISETKESVGSIPSLKKDLEDIQKQMLNMEDKIDSMRGSIPSLLNKGLKDIQKQMLNMEDLMQNVRECTDGISSLQDQDDKIDSMCSSQEKFQDSTFDMS